MDHDRHRVDVCVSKNEDIICFLCSRQLNGVAPSGAFGLHTDILEASGCVGGTGDHSWKVVRLHLRWSQTHTCTHQNDLAIHVGVQNTPLVGKLSPCFEMTSYVIFTLLFHHFCHSLCFPVSLQVWEVKVGEKTAEKPLEGTLSNWGNSYFSETKESYRAKKGCIFG